MAEQLLNSSLYIPFENGEESTRVFIILTALKKKLKSIQDDISRNNFKPS